MAVRLANTKPNPRAISHEGAHLFQHGRPNVFIVSWEAKGWYWSSLECDGGPYTCSVYAFLAAKEYWITMGPYSYNKRWVPSRIFAAYDPYGPMDCAPSNAFWVPSDRARP